jgi:hypothetical protein
MPAQAQEIFFEEEQSFRQRWVWALMGATLVLLVVPLGFVLAGAPVKHGSDDIFSGVVGLGLGIAVVIGVAVLMYTMKLTVRLDDQALHVRFFPLLPPNQEGHPAGGDRPLGGPHLPPDLGVRRLGYSLRLERHGLQRQRQPGRPIGTRQRQAALDRLAAPRGTGDGNHPGEAAGQVICALKGSFPFSCLDHRWHGDS